MPPTPADLSGSIRQSGTMLLAVALAGCVALGLADAYQAVTGKRLSKRPSTRTDEQMRRQSAIAAVVLISLAALALIVGV
jgi:hypothetical protein